MGAINSRVWKANIYGMLQHISLGENDTYNIESINSKLAKYEHVQDIGPLLELVLWKSKITEQSNGNLIDKDARLMCRIDSLCMVNVIVSNVLSFLVDG